MNIARDLGFLGESTEDSDIYSAYTDSMDDYEESDEHDLMSSILFGETIA